MHEVPAPLTRTAEYARRAARDGYLDFAMSHRWDPTLRVTLSNPLILWVLNELVGQSLRHSARHRAVA